MKYIYALLLCLGACAVTPPATLTPPPHPLSWLSGCWVSDDGTYREVWSENEGGYLFGYATALKNGQAVFFEQTRIDPGPPLTMNAYPAGKGPSAFPRISQTATSITFANPAHDYPQKITYARVGDALTARISLIDNTRSGDFAFKPCAR